MCFNTKKINFLLNHVPISDKDGPATGDDSFSLSEEKIFKQK